MSEALEELFLFGEEKMEKAIAQLKKEFGTIRSGRANPLILDKVGTYEIRYTATDLSGNAETLSVRILVQEKALEQSGDTHSKKENAWVIPVIVGASVLVVGVVVAVILFKRKED